MFLGLFIFWCVLNGRITLEICIFGVLLSAAVCALMCGFCGYSIDKEKKLFRNFGLLIAFAWVLVKEIVKSSIRVMEIVLNKNIRIEQALVTFDADLKTEASRVMLANAITMTPGTITVLIEDNHYTVHCLSREMIDGIEDGEFVRLLKRMEA